MHSVYASKTEGKVNFQQNVMLSLSYSFVYAILCVCVSFGIVENTLTG